MSDRASDSDLNRYGKRLMGSQYICAKSKDRINITTPGVYIINLQSAEQKTYDGEGGGTHWTSLLVSPSSYFYFDSFGFPPPQEMLNQLEGRKGVYFKSIVQPYKSDLCGYYDLYVMNALVNGHARVGRDGELYSTEDNKLLFTNTHINDKHVRKFKQALQRYKP